MDVLRFEVFNNCLVTIASLLLLSHRTKGTRFDETYNDTNSSTVFYFTLPGKQYDSLNSLFTQCKASNYNLLELRDSLVQKGFEKFSNEILSQYGNSMTYITGLNRRDFENWSWLSDDPNSTHFRQSDIEDFDSRSWTSYLDCSQTSCAYKANADMNSERSFICMDTETCNENSNKMIISNHCYELVNKILNWFQARNICLDRKGDLAQYIDRVNDLWRSGNPTGFWVGLVKSRWYWMQYNGDMTEAAFTNWLSSPSEASECTAVRMSDGLKWTASTCSGFYYIICTEKYARLNTNTKPSTLLPSTTTSADSTIRRTKDVSQTTQISSTPTIPYTNATTNSTQNQSSVAEEKPTDVLRYAVSGAVVLCLAVIISTLVCFFAWRRYQSTKSRRDDQPEEPVYDSISVSLPHPYITQRQTKNLRPLPELRLQRSPRVQSIYFDGTNINSRTANRLYSNINRDSFIEAVFSDEYNQSSNKKLEDIAENDLEEEPRYVKPHIAKRPVTNV